MPKLSDTLAPLPICPFAVANIAAVVMLRICVIKDKTVLFICTAALIASRGFINGIFNISSANTVVSCIALFNSGRVNNCLPVWGSLNKGFKSTLNGFFKLTGVISLEPLIPFLIKKSWNSLVSLNKNLPLPKLAISL